MFEPGVVSDHSAQPCVAESHAASGLDTPVPPGEAASLNSKERMDIEEEAVARLAAMVPGAGLAALVEELLSGLLTPAVGADADADDDDTALFGNVANPGERALLAAASSHSLVGDPSGAGDGEDVAAALATSLGAQVLSELVAATGRLAAWAQWAHAVATALLSRTPEMSAYADSWGPGGRAVRRLPAEYARFNTTSEVACRLGATRTSAAAVVDRGRALLTPALAPTEQLHRVGLLDDSKVNVITRRLEGVEPEVASTVQARVLPRAPHRTTTQLSHDVDKALTALDPDGASTRRGRNVSSRRITRPKPAGDGVHSMWLVMPTMDAFLLDATLDAVAASARAAGDKRSTGQLRADALVAMSLNTLRAGQQHAFEESSPRAGASSRPDGNPPAGQAPVSQAPPAGGAPAARAPSPWWNPLTSWSPAEQPPPAQRLLPDGVPLEGMLAALSGLVGSTSPWWTPSGTDPVFPTPGLSINIDVTVPLDQLVEHTRSATAGSPDDDAAASSGAPPEPPGVHSAAAEVTIGANTVPIPSVTTWALAAGGTWRRLVTDPVSGTILDVGRTHYRPPDALRDLVRARDAHCAHPGCAVPAARCDLDHVTAWNIGGSTSLPNLTSLCQTHHRLKHTPGWSLVRTPAGSLLWTTPSGARYERTPDGSVTMLPRRIGPRHIQHPGGPVPQRLAAAVTPAVLDRLNRGLTNNAEPADKAVGWAVLTTRGPRPGEYPGAFEAVPYPPAIHALGLAPLLDEIPPF